MRSIGELLKEERQRLGLSQDEFAAAGGLKRRAQTLYERDERAPDTDYLRALIAIGVDVKYVLTGEKTSSALTQDEADLLVRYRDLDATGKARILGVAEGLAALIADGSGKRGQKSTFHGDVGQQISGDLHAPAVVNMRKRKANK
jgi:transcriptional regulator with XRE-family HTH domain